MERRNRLRIVAVLVAFALPCALLAGAELVARTIHPLPERFYVWEPGLSLAFRPRSEIMPGVDGPSRFVVNALGLRGDDVDGGERYRVLCIGGSSTECLYLDQSEAWPARLQARLREAAPQSRAWIGNAGRSGHSTREHVLQIEELLAHEPRIDAVVLMAGVNDLGKRLSRDRDYDPDWLAPPGARDELLRSAFAVGPPGPWDVRPPYKRTALWGALSRWRGQLFGDPRAQDAEGAIYVRWRELRRGASRVRDELPDLAGALQEFRGNLALCAEACEQRGARLVLVEQACLWRADLPEELARLLWMGGVGDYQRQASSEYYSAAALALGIRAYNATLAAFAGERGLELVALDRVLPKDTGAFYDDVHLNEAGARLAADALAAHFLALPPFAAEPGSK